MARHVVSTHDSCTEAHPAPSVALEAPVELPPRASALAAWHRAKAGGAVDRAEGCRRPSRGEVGANGATRGVNACTAARRHILRHRLPSKLLSNSLQERPPSPHGTVRRRAAPSIERRAAGGLREEKCAPRATDGAGCASVQLCMCPPPLDRRRLRRLRMVPCGDAGGSKRGIKRRLKATRAHAARLELRGRTRCLLARDASPACLRGDGCAGGEAPCAIDRNIASSAATIVRLATPGARLPHTDT